MYPGWTQHRFIDVSLTSTTGKQNVALSYIGEEKDGRASVRRREEGIKEERKMRACVRACVCVCDIYVLIRGSMFIQQYDSHINL